MLQKFTLLLIGFFILFSSCEQKDPDEGVPAFIEINTASIDAGTGQGSDSSDVSDAWLYVDSKLIGAFEIPFSAPILMSGNQNIEIRYGVLLNGIAATRTINPFYSYTITPVNLIPRETVLIEPQSTYNPSTQFVWNSIGQEGFEEGGISIDSVVGTSTKIVKTSTDVYEGSFSGHIFLDEDHTTYIGQSTEKFVLPKSGNAVLMEIHCKNISNHFAIGMFVEAVDGQVTVVNHLVVNPGADWKKLYVNFTELVSNYPSAANYRVFFTAELESTNTTADIYLDNIKLMHF